MRDSRLHHAAGIPAVTVAELMDVVSEWETPTVTQFRRAADFRVVSYPTAKGSAAAYHPEANVLVPTNSVADESGTPTSKGVVVRLEAAAAGVQNPHGA